MNDNRRELLKGAGYGVGAAIGLKGVHEIGIKLDNLRALYNEPVCVIERGEASELRG